jgi:hypothetical protein
MKKPEKKVVPSEYDTLSIVELEKRVEQNHLLSREAQKEMYVMLEYLRTSNRYKENPRYKKSSFWEYLEDRWTIRQGTYRENVRAFTKFPDFAVEYGTGLVTAIEGSCGSLNTAKVIAEIMAAEATHKEPMKRMSIQAVIDKHAKPRITQEKPDWRVMYKDECARHEQTKKALKVAMATVTGLQQQVERLKRTVDTFERVRDVFEGYDEELRVRIADSHTDTPAHA